MKPKRLLFLLILCSVVLMLLGCADLVNLIAGSTPAPTATPNANPYSYVDSLQNPFGRFWISGFAEGTVTVAWEANTGCTSILVEKRLNSENTVTIATLPSSATSYTFSGINPSSDYSAIYSIRPEFPNLPNPSASPPSFQFYGGCARAPGSGTLIAPPSLSENQFSPKNGYIVSGYVEVPSGNRMIYAIADNSTGPFHYFDGMSQKTFKTFTHLSNQTKYIKAMLYTSSGASQWSNIVQVNTGSPTVIPARDSGMLQGTYANSSTSTRYHFNLNGTVSSTSGDILLDSGSYSFTAGLLTINFSTSTLVIQAVVSADEEFLIFDALKKTSPGGISTMDGTYSANRVTTTSSSTTTESFSTEISIAHDLTVTINRTNTAPSIRSNRPDVVKLTPVFKTPNDIYIPDYYPQSIFRKQ